MWMVLCKKSENSRLLMKYGIQETNIYDIYFYIIYQQNQIHN